MYVVNNLKGSCFFAGGSSPFCEHLMVVVSEQYDGYALAVPISSVRYNPDGSFSRYVDQSCVFEVDDIKTPEGRNVLTKKSFVLYKEAKEIVCSQMMYDQLKKIYEYRCNVTPEILQRIQDGAKNTYNLEGRFEKYFDFF